MAGGRSNLVGSRFRCSGMAGGRATARPPHRPRVGYVCVRRDALVIQAVVDATDVTDVTDVTL